MMEQEIGFCTTSDGVSIAYATLGEGPPLVYATGWPGHLSLEMETPHSRELIEDLAQGVTLIRYDMRGSGLSEHDPGELSFDRCVLDLEAVVDHLKLDTFALLSLGFLAGPISIAYAGKHPGRLSHLIMSDAYARGVELTTPERSKAMVDYISLYGFPMSVDDKSTPEDVKRIQDVAKIQREAAPLEVQGEVARMMTTVDVSGYLKKLSMPTLIMHGRDDTIVPFALGRNLAASLPEAKFVPFDDSVAAPWRKQERITSAIRRFLGIEVESKPKPAPAPAADVYTILFTDIESSTELTQRLGDAKAQEVVHAHNQIVRDALRAHSGDEIKHTGDGIMASFSSSSGALGCAVAIQQAVAAHVEKHPEMPLSIYIGLNAGEPVVEDSDLFGTAVQLASRICDKAGPGEILVSNVVRELAAGKGFLFSDRGESELRGFEDPVRLYEVSWKERE
ncbi:MAG: adenylate/guanylate cyclase domain-containing protein [Chloroflexi bacterium]|nr:adenylate/guanylate cyclase domain-containing protein [Chloroflexota bacterium]